jgi:hypothetical protein
MIHLAGEHNTPFLLMGNATGASARFAAKMTDNKKFSKGYELISKLAEMVQEREGVPHIFREGVDPFNSKSLETLQSQLHEEAKQRTAREWIDRVVGDSPTGRSEDELWSDLIDSGARNTTASRPV